MNMYQLSRGFWDFAFENPESMRPNHIALYFFSIEHCNRLGWKEKFGLPTGAAMEAVGIKSYSVYKRTFDDLAEWGFFEVIQYSKNQYTANIIALKENYKAHSKALDKAIAKHSVKHLTTPLQSIVSIDIHTNKETINHQTIKQKNAGEGDDEIEKKIDWVEAEKAEMVAVITAEESPPDSAPPPLIQWPEIEPQLMSTAHIEKVYFELRQYIGKPPAEGVALIKERIGVFQYAFKDEYPDGVKEVKRAKQYFINWFSKQLEKGFETAKAKNNNATNSRNQNKLTPNGREPVNGRSFGKWEDVFGK